MGAWSAEPFGNDDAADWAWELAEAADWDFVGESLGSATPGSDSEAHAIAIAAAETVAHGLGRPTQSDVYTEDIEAFVARAGAPSPALVERAMSALAVATAPTSELAQLWQDDPADWTEAISKLRTALEG